MKSLSTLNCAQKVVLKILFIMASKFSSKPTTLTFVFIDMTFTSNGMMQIAITENFKSDREKCLNLALLEYLSHYAIFRLYFSHLLRAVPACSAPFEKSITLSPCKSCKTTCCIESVAL